MLSAVIFLSDFSNDHFINKDKTDYSIMLRNELDRFNKHKAVTMFPKLWEEGLRWDGVSQLALHLNNDLTKMYPFSDNLKSRFNNNFSNLIKYLSLINLP